MTTFKMNHIMVASNISFFNCWICL